MGLGEGEEGAGGGRGLSLEGAWCVGGCHCGWWWGEWVGREGRGEVLVLRWDGARVGCAGIL